MESVVEKLGFFDFFNLIIVGIFTIVGCFGITYQFDLEISKKIFTYLKDTAEVNTLFLVLSVSAIITVSYIIGLLCLEAFNLIDKKLKTFDNLVKDLFTRDSCIENEKKRIQYANIAKTVFDYNGIDHEPREGNPSGLEWDWSLNNYFFTYCVYQLQIRGLNRKTEKLRDIEGLAKSFCISNVLLLSVLQVVGGMHWNTFLLPYYFVFIEVILLIVIILIFIVYRKNALKNRIRMTLALFEAVYIKETMDSKTKEDNKNENDKTQAKKEE